MLLEFIQISSFKLTFRSELRCHNPPAEEGTESDRCKGAIRCLVVHVKGLIRSDTVECEQQAEHRRDVAQHRLRCARLEVLEFG